MDSLKAVDKVSIEYYKNQSFIQKLKFASRQILESKNSKQPINIDSLGVSLYDKNELKNKEYISYLKQVIKYKYFQNKKRPSNSQQFDFVLEDKASTNNNAKPYLLDSYLESIFSMEKEKFNHYLDKFNSYNTNIELENKWIKFLTDLETNSKKLNSENRTIGVLTNLLNDNKFTFEQVLSAQNGKIILVDFWASWCSPCRREMPYLKILKDRFDKNEIQIIEISIDKDYSAWERASKLEEISNQEHNYIISNWEKSKLYKNYNIKTIPRYLLFDKEGKIISDDAPRPSDKKLEELIKASI